MPSKYINILTDFGFKRIFADENNKDLLIDFLNSVMSIQNIQIQDITYKNTEFIGESPDDKKVILDLYCISDKGEHFLVEVQRAKQKYFHKRFFFYATRLIQEQGVKDPNWDYNFNAVYSIGILEFDSAFHHDILTDYCVLNKKTSHSLIEDFGIFLIDLTKFNKQVHELTTNFDRWIYILKNLDKINEVPKQLNEGLFVKLFKLAEFRAMNKEQQRAYMDSLKRYNDWQNVLDYAHEKGYHEAELKYEGLLQQMIRRAEEEKRRAEEEKKRADENFLKMIELAKLLKSMGVDAMIIKEKTGLTDEDIQKI